MNIVHTEKLDGYTLNIMPDFDPMSPFEWDDGLINIFSNSSYTEYMRYGMGKEIKYYDMLMEYSRLHNLYAIVLHVYRDGRIYPSHISWYGELPIHPGHEFSTLIFIDLDQARKMYHWERITEKRKKFLYQQIQYWIDMYNQYAENDVYGYAILDPQGEHLDSCWGLYGYDYALAEATNIFRARVKREVETRREFDLPFPIVGV